MLASVVLEHPIESERCTRDRARREPLAARRDRIRHESQRSRQIGDALLGGASAALRIPPIAFLFLEGLLHLPELLAQEIELARVQRSEVRTRDAQVFGIATRFRRR